MSPDRIRFDLPASGVQRLAARFGGHAFDSHRHETYGIGLTLWGAQSFHYRGALRTSRAGQVIVLHPDEAHDGHAGAETGFAYRMLYVDPAAVSQALDGAGPPFVAAAVTEDAVLAGLLTEAFGDFPAPLEPLAVDALVEGLARRLAQRAGASRPARGRATPHRAVQAARELLAAEARRSVGSEELEKATGLDRFALARHFRAVTGTSPHRYQVGRRLARAQALIAAGSALSEVAIDTGFADQSHLTRHFAARFGVTPGRWAALARRR
ncbi:MAG: AraC family transcriptional regulator [Reyranellaceae bacterium]